MAATEDHRLPSKNERTRARIIAAAAELFQARGYNGVSLRDIAAAADLQVGSLYYHFDSRDELVAEIIGIGQDLISLTVADGIESLTPGALDIDRLRCVLTAHAASLATQGNYTAAAIRLMNTSPPGIYQRQATASRNYGNLWRDLLTAAQKAGQVRANLDVSAMRMFMIGALNSTPDWYRPQRRGLSSEALAAEFAAVFLEGLATRRGHRRGLPTQASLASLASLASSQMDSASPHEPSRGERTRRRVLDAAAHAFRETGFKETSFGDIAKRAGIRRESIYYYFPSLESLAEELLREAWRRTDGLVRSAIDRLPQEASALDRFQAAIAAHLFSMLGEGGYTAGLVHVLARLPAELRAQSLGFQRAYLEYWRSLAEDARSAGEIREDLHLPSVVLVLINALNWSVEWYNADGPLQPAALAEQFVVMVMDGLQTTRPRRRRPARPLT